jgi:hypothetical protein
MKVREWIALLCATAPLLASQPTAALSVAARDVRPFVAGPGRAQVVHVLALAQSSDEPPDDDPEDVGDDLDDDVDDPGVDDPGADDDAAGGSDDDGPGGSDDDGPDGSDDDGPAAADASASRGSGGFGLSGGGRQAVNESDGAPSRWRDLFALGPDEIYDAAGYVARRGQLLALDPSERALAEARALGYAVTERFRLAAAGIDVVRLRLPDHEQVGDALASLRAADPGAVFDYEHLYDFSPSGTEDIERTAAATKPRRSLSKRDDLAIGLIDSAIDPATPAIKGARIQQRVFVSTGEPPSREHGTAVASILAGRDNGLLPHSQYFVASVFHQSSRGESIGAAADLARAIDWLMTQRTPVINMSLAGPPNAILEAAVRRAQDRGHIVVAAVGNAGPAARPQFPAAYAGVVGVTAIDANGRVYRRAVRGQQVDFAAPGVAVTAASPAGTEGAVSGTSFAAPYVAAVLALRHTTLDPLSARRAVSDLVREATDLGDPGHDPIFGFGAVPLAPMTR